jgi:hypothetical protein
MVQRIEHIRRFPLPRGLFERLQKLHPHLTDKDCQLVGKGLRQFFLAYAKSGYKYVSMPSQVVDDLWHEFILYTKHYEIFCRKSFGRFLHHTPAVVLSSSQQSNAGLRRCWWYACQDELINPKKPTRLPLLFALDAKLNIEGGFRYAANCNLLARPSSDTAGSTTHCGGDFASVAVDGSIGGGDDSSGSGWGDSDGGGDGGCGGGGD